MQLVFGRDAIINTKFIADWITFVSANNKSYIIIMSEKKKRIPRMYQFGDRVMLKKYNQHKYGSPEYEGPYAITTVNDNGTVRIQRRKFYDVVNIRNISSLTISE